MILYQIGNNGYFEGSLQYPDDPDDIFGIPYGTTKQAPPDLDEGEYAVWTGSGWSKTTVPPAPVVPQVVVPQSVSKYQAKMALLEFGLFEQVESFVQQSTDLALKIAWNDASNFYRDNAFIASLAVQFNLTDQQVDDLFIAANNY